MKGKLFASIFVLMIIMSTFLFPMTAYAYSDSEPPTISAWLIEDILYIEASDSGSGVEAVYMDSYQCEDLIDGATQVNAKENHDNHEYISVYAIDCARNKSDVIEINNPFYTVQEPTVSAVPEKEPELNPFTPDGNGEVVDNATEDDSKEFYTITTPEGNIFFLVIDRQRDSDNVYLLNSVTEYDLAMLAEEGGSTSQSAISTPDPVPIELPEPMPDPEPEPVEPPARDSSTGTMIFLLIAVAVVGGAGYYLKIYKPKQDGADTEDDFEYGEDMEYEDDEYSEDEYGDDSNDESDILKDESDYDYSGDDSGFALGDEQ